MSFISGIEIFVAKIRFNITEVKINSARKLFEKVVKDTPVGKPELWKRNPPVGYVPGQLKANWQCTLNSPATSVLDERDTSGSATISKIRAVLADAGLEDTIYLTNKVPYAERIEYFGHSSQAPEGMARINVAAFQHLVQAEVSKVK